jgi:signal transduction histidine kinase
MSLHRRLTAWAADSGALPRRTVRLRLTGFYGGLFLGSGAALLAITYALVVHATTGFIFTGQNGSAGSFTTSPHAHAAASQDARGNFSVSGGAQGLTQSQQLAEIRRLTAEASSQHAAVLHALLIQSGIALAIMAVLSIALGWIIAGRILRPLRTITAATREISAANLDARLALDRPDDELKELGDTIDGLLERLEASFRAQRQFIANASHELRTPLARQRVLSQVALADPGASIESLREAHVRVLASGAEQEQLIAALLTLAKGQGGPGRQDRFDLAALTSRALSARQDEASVRDLDVYPAISAAAATGDPRLVEHLIANLLDNALRHNVTGGWIEVTTRTQDRHAILSVDNTGPEIPATAVDRLLQPFQRLAAGRAGHGRGLGLGLSIVDAIATAHGAALSVRPRPGGGLEIEVRFPPLAKIIKIPNESWCLPAESAPSPVPASAVS